MRASLLSLFLSIAFGVVTPVRAAQETKYVVFFGDSLTAGFGLSPDEAYPALIQSKLPSNYRVQNSGVSGDTTSDGLRRLTWALRNEPAIFVLALGANDGLRGLDPLFIRENLKKIIAEVRKHWPTTKLILAGIDLPTNLGEEYRQEFRQIFPDLAKEQSLTFIPFLLEGVAGEARLNQADGIHPNAAGHRIIAENVWKILKGQL